MSSTTEQVERQEWGRQFQDALQSKDANALVALAIDAERTPSLSAIDDRQDQTPLAWAIFERSAWGVEQLLRSCQFGIDYEEVLVFFVALGQFNAEHHRPQAQELMAEVWPVMRAVLETSVSGRLSVLGAFLRYMPDRDATIRRNWEGLGMQALCEGVVDTPFFPLQTNLSLTALQAAWINALPVAVELLLDAGASATRPQPTTLLPDWDLAGATAERDLVCDQGLSSLKIQAHARQRWSTPSPTVAQGLGDALVSICDFRNQWQGVDQRVKAQLLDHTLPAVRARAPCPRF